MAVVVLLGLLLSGCASGPAQPDPLRLMVPTPAGGGYDTTARVLALTLEESGLSGEVEVFHLTGQAGTTALTRLVHEKGNDRLLMQMGLGLVGSSLTTGTPSDIGRATALARLVEEPEVVVVPADSPYRTLDDLVGAWKTAPGLRAGVGSHPGGPDHQALMLIAEHVGLSPADVPFGRYDGGGELLAALLSHKVDFAVTGSAEYRHAIAAGRLRVLAVTGAEPVAGITAPTLRQAGYDLEVVNWRGLMAPPGLTPQQRGRLTDLLRRLRATPEWERALRDNGWTDAYLPGDAFARFLTSENRRVGILLDRLGIPRSDATPSPARTPS
ncbi:tripartite tricarboxylate transporter substrate-binding protein [Streptomyces sp. 549]|uniref:Bug family tripartite tricarboxylate transporter substrate binding protein n=1 Tax=Streptomyces sp. 549 TaxID=3049076 RepID=UPI0024C3AF44|nr:tripartite tricarboxylate transporter substrate-binding protein [Streptomyces sp. 549]MDK1476790.1 tripartite tricarboxylate transporter substrate-binding protein [Streptomyces sp. 549]